MKDRDGRLIWSGQYDLYELWHHFGIPDDLKGQSVIDIGTAAGFFGFMCKKRLRHLSLLPNCRESKTRKLVVVPRTTA